MQNVEKSVQSAPASQRRPYQAPAVQDLGRWEAMTLSYTLPLGPGGMSNGGTFTSGGSHGNW